MLCRASVWWCTFPSSLMWMLINDWSTSPPHSCFFSDLLPPLPLSTCLLPNLPSSPSTLLAKHSLQPPFTAQIWGTLPIQGALWLYVCLSSRRCSPCTPLILTCCSSRSQVLSSLKSTPRCIMLSLDSSSFIIFSLPDQQIHIFSMSVLGYACQEGHHHCGNGHLSQPHPSRQGSMQPTTVLHCPQMTAVLHVHMQWAWVHFFLFLHRHWHRYSTYSNSTVAVGCFHFYRDGSLKSSNCNIFNECPTHKLQ